MPSSTYYEKFAWGALSGVCGGLAVYVSMRMRRLQPHLQPVARKAVAAASSAPPCPIPTRPSLSAGAQQAAAVLKRIVPPLDGTTYKGQGGRVGILGGSVDYTGAPFYDAMAALRVGAELCTIYTATEAASAIKSYSPELMVTPVYSHTTLSTGGTIAASTETDKMVKTVLSGAERLHVSDINSTILNIYFERFFILRRRTRQMYPETAYRGTVVLLSAAAKRGQSSP